MVSVCTHPLPSTRQADGDNNDGDKNEPDPECQHVYHELGAVGREKGQQRRRYKGDKKSDTEERPTHLGWYQELFPLSCDHVTRNLMAISHRL